MRRPHGGGSTEHGGGSRPPGLTRRQLLLAAGGVAALVAARAWSGGSSRGRPSGGPGEPGSGAPPGQAPFPPFEPTNAPSIPTGSCVLGANVLSLQRLGLADRQYVSWDSDIEDPTDPHAFLRPTTEFLNVKFAPKVGWEKGTNALWEEIASGSQDAQAEVWAARLNRVERRLAIALHHEPIPRAAGGGEGFASDLVAAVRRVAGLWRAAGVHHLLGQALVDGVFRSDSQDDQLAIEVLDIVGVDGYGDATKGLYTADAVLGPALAYAVAHGKPLVIFETSFHSATPDQQRVFFESLDRYLQANGDIIGCCLFVSGDNTLDQAGLEVVLRMAADPYYSRVFP
jgi:hypothetical protein